jgi:enoyl-[acyl-carrier protein] reductase II
LIPSVVSTITIPLIAAGGIGSGTAMAACLALGADAVQIGSRFVVSIESSAHPAFKERILAAQEGDTKLSLKVLTPVRLLKNDFAERVQALESEGASKEKMIEVLGRARAKKGMFEGDLEEGELEIGQVSAQFDKLLPAGSIVTEIWRDCLFQISKLQLKYLG